ncbi:MAG: hypothetical protein DHS20C03_32890 [Minwuia thermotolerans]|nr:MAG: hypothetical protein DHS20C03_32890 [Minwuia thermotolerans]
MRTLPVAFFLACSWFWCIGGFFPVLLQQEFGQVAFLCFMVFNIVGATLFGFVWSNDARQRFHERHRLPAQFFSVLVIGYHCIFMAWLSALLHDPTPLIAFVGVSVTCTALKQHLNRLAIVLFAVTASLFLFAWTGIDAGAAAMPQSGPQPFTHQILPLALGFLLAPYFDLTFHRAYAASANPRLAFLLGFGVLFLALLGGMYLATPVFALLLTAGSLTGSGLQAVVAILVLQTGFTTAAHLREVQATQWSRSRFALPAVGVVVTLSALHLAVGQLMPAMTVPAGELVYRGFVFLIGVLFPVILLFGGLTRQALPVMAFLTPCYTLGFLIGGQFAPFLSVAMVGLAVAFWLRLRSESTDRRWTATATRPGRESRT